MSGETVGRIAALLRNQYGSYSPLEERAILESDLSANASGLLYGWGDRTLSTVSLSLRHPVVLKAKNSPVFLFQSMI